MYGSEINAFTNKSSDAGVYTYSLNNGQCFSCYVAQVEMALSSIDTPCIEMTLGVDPVIAAIIYNRL